MPLCTIPQSCTALTYLWTLADNGRITRREAYISTKMCARILSNKRISAQFKHTIDVGNLTQEQFVDAYEDLPLVGWELEAIFHALTR